MVMPPAEALALAERERLRVLLIEHVDGKVSRAAQQRLVT